MISMFCLLEKVSRSDESPVDDLKLEFLPAMALIDDADPNTDLVKEAVRYAGRYVRNLGLLLVQIPLRMRTRRGMRSGWGWARGAGQRGSTKPKTELISPPLLFPARSPSIHQRRTPIEIPITIPIPIPIPIPIYMDVREWRRTSWSPLSHT